MQPPADRAAVSRAQVSTKPASRSAPSTVSKNIVPNGVSTHPCSLAIAALLSLPQAYQPLH